MMTRLMSTKGMKMIQTKEHPTLVLNPFLIYIGVAVLAALMQLLVPLPFIPPQAARITGLVIMIANFMLGLPALRKMSAAKTSPNPNKSTTALILTGPYRFTRNPMYIGLTLMYAGLVTFLQLPWGLLFTPIVIWLITAWVIRPEEQYLECKFGDEYLKYKERVHRWI
jgi:protein-S-isoprenylcysteine O-methyltransferase Ste14